MVFRQTDISGPIVESLYSEALVLADEVRSAFNLARREEETIGPREDYRLALSLEGLRTTTRIMHTLAWLLNHRALLSAEMSEQQVRLHGTLPKNRPSDPELLAHFVPSLRELIAESERLHERIARLDLAWRKRIAMPHPPIVRMHRFLRQEVARAQAAAF